jgi:hypothetical protein
MRISGKKSIRKAVDTYNSREKPAANVGELRVGITPNGIGLAYSF